MRPISPVRDMRAAAELAAEIGNTDNADAFAIFFAEQSHGSGGEGLIEIHDVGFDFGVGEDLLIDDPFDFAEFVFGHGRSSG